MIVGVKIADLIRWPQSAKPIPRGFNSRCDVCGETGLKEKGACFRCYLWLLACSQVEKRRKVPVRCLN